MNGQKLNGCAFDLSIRQQAAALAIAKLADDGKLRLEQPIGDLIPDLSPSLQRITVEQLLTHTAGLADDAPMMGSPDEMAILRAYWLTLAAVGGPLLLTSWERLVITAAGAIAMKLVIALTPAGPEAG